MRWRSLVGETILGPIRPTGRPRCEDGDGDGERDNWAVAWVVPDEEQNAPSRGGRVESGLGVEHPRPGPVARRRWAAGLVLAAAALLMLPRCDGRTLVGTPVGPADGRSAGTPPAAAAGAGRTEGSAPAAAGVEAQAILDATLTGSGPGCSAAFGERGFVAWAGTRGLADARVGTVLTADSRFAIGAIGEQFTAAMVVLLANEGRLHLDDAVSEHLGGLPSWADAVTVDDLLHHRSGLPSDPAVVDPTDHPVIDRARQVTRLDRPPGSRFEDAAIDDALLAAVVEAASGRELGPLIEERIGAPLGLHLSVGEAGPVVGHRAVGGVSTPVPDGPAPESGGGIRATPSDLVRWADNRRTGVVGGPALTSDATEGTVPTGVNGGRYGAGVYLDADGGVDQTGSSPGYAVALSVRPGGDRAIALACNDDSVPSATIMQALRRIWFSGP